MIKMSKVFLGIGALTMLASGALAISLAANPKEAVKAEASTLTDKLILRLDTDTWKSSSSKIAICFIDGSGTREWGDFVTPDGIHKHVEYSYDLSITPHHYVAFRFDPGVVTAGDWCFENDRSNDAIWSTTNDIGLGDIVWLGNYYPSSKWTESGSFTVDTYIKGGSSDNWETPTVNAQLNDVKITKTDEIEVFGKVSLPANTYFKAHKAAEGDSGWVGSYTAYESIQSNLENSEKGNIHNTQAATYEFYFNYEAKSLYITDPIIAAADEWGQYFTSNAGCDKVGNASPTGWSLVATEYAKLDGDVKDYIYDLHAVKGGTYIEDALFDYDWAITRNPDLEKFVKDSDNHVRTPKIAIANTPSILGNVNNTAVIATVVIVSLVAVTTIGGIIILKRKER